MTFLKITVFLFTLISCQAQDLIAKKCINEKINSSELYKINNDEKVRFFKSFQEIEFLLLNKLDLDRSNKINYFKIFKHLDKNVYSNSSEIKYYKSEIDEILIKNNISPVSIIGEINSLVLKCFYENDDNEVKIRNQNLFKYVDVFNQIFANGGLLYEVKDLEAISNSLSEEQFDQLLHRIPILMMMYENLNNN